MTFWEKISGNTENFSFEDRLFNSTAFTSAVIFLMSLIFNEFEDFSHVFDLILGAATVLFIGIYYLSRFRRQIRLSKVMLITAGYLFFPVAWRYNQGLTGTTIFFFFVFVLLVIAFLKSHRLLFGLGSALFVGMIIVAQIKYPEWVIPYKDKNAEFNDFLYAFIISSTIFVFTASWLKGSYDREHLHVMEQNQTLAAQRDALSQQNELIELQKKQLEEANALSNKMFSIISHDLRSPLANLATILDVITETELSPEESNNFLKIVQRDLNNTSNLLDNLLNWAKKQRHGLEQHPSSFDLVPLVAENMQLYESRAKTKGIHLHIEPCAPQYALADAQMIRLVLRNLIGNAVKFCRPGDQIGIHFDHSQAGKIIVEVRDTGIGIAPAEHHRVFADPDYTVRGTDNEKGSGLGLILCRDFVLSNGGQIWFESTGIGGTRFFFSLPQA